MAAVVAAAAAAAAAAVAVDESCAEKKIKNALWRDHMFVSYDS